MVRTALLVTCLVGAGVATEPLPLELDHISIVVPPGAPMDGPAFEAAGFRFLGPPTVHPGEGITTRSVGFENLYIELVWVTNRAELTAADPDWGLRLRHNDPKFVRFGLALRRHEAGDSIPFPTREFGSRKLRVSQTANQEPFVFVVPPELAWPAQAAALAAEMKHPNGARKVTRVTWVTRKRGGPSPAMDYVGTHGVVRFGFAAPYFIEMELDDGALGKVTDLRPQLPIVFRR